MTDPGPFLSTVAASSAGLVAIVGGLLVARFVTLDSEQQGAQRVLDDANERLTVAIRRSEDARLALKNWDVSDFFEKKVLRTIGDGTLDIAELRKIGGYTPLSDEDLGPLITEIHSQFDVARKTLRQLIPDPEQLSDADEWEMFRNQSHGLPEINWDEVWEIAYAERLEAPRTPSPWRPHIPAVLSLTFRPPEYVALEMQRRDSLRSSLDRARQYVEDVSGEVTRLQQARDAVVRPKGLRFGLVILGYFALVGVIIPIWMMSRAPQKLSPTMGNVIFLLFISAFLALLGYMTLLALRLSRRKQNAGR